MAEPTSAHPSPSPRAWQQVLEHIEHRLTAGDLVPGDHLPGERALSADLGVGRSSVREALRVLEAMGLVHTATGSGPSAGAVIVATPHGAMTSLMRLQVAAHGFPVADIVRTRLILETSVASDLASAPDVPDLADADLLLDAMDEPELSPSTFLALDAQFHLALAQAAGNEVITATMAGLRGGIEGYALDGSARIADWDATCDRLRGEHRGILAAIRRKDASDARSRIRAHISGYYDEISPDSPAAATAPDQKASSSEW